LEVTSVSGRSAFVAATGTNFIHLNVGCQTLFGRFLLHAVAVHDVVQWQCYEWPGFLAFTFYLEKIQMSAMTKLPKHFANYRGHQLRVETARFKLRYAALMTMPRGTLKELGDALGISTTSMTYMIGSGHINGDMCVKLERICGRADFPRQWFNPELYSLAMEA
jgi:hypothetical protein